MDYKSVAVGVTSSRALLQEPSEVLDSGVLFHKFYDPAKNFRVVAPEY